MADETTKLEKGAVELKHLRQLARRTAGNLSDLGEVLVMLGVFYGVCETAADVVEKTVEAIAFEKVAGAKVIVKFTTANTANNATLNVNDTGAALITYQGAAIGKSQLGAGKFRMFLYDGENYEFVGDINTTHNTFSGASASSNGTKGLVPQPVSGDQNKFLMGNATWGNVPTMQGATDEAGGSAGLVPKPIAGEDEYFLKGNGSWAQVSGSSGGSSNYSQITKTNVTAPKEVTIPLPKSNRFQYAPPNVLLFVPGTTDVVETACDFDNGDATDFDYSEKYVTFDGTMKPTTAYEAEVDAPVALGNGYLSTSEEITVSEYKAVENVSAGGGNTVGIALISSGGGSGTWATFAESSTAVLLINGSAYDSEGNLLAENWASLTDAEKEAIFDAADVLDAVPSSLYSAHSISMGTPTALGDGYVSSGEEIDFDDYESVESITVESGSAVGIALISSGGGSGTWATFRESSAAIIVSSAGAAYDFNGNLLSDGWSALSDSEKETAFQNAVGDNPLAIAKTLGTFHFEVYSQNNALPTCSLVEENAVRSFRVAMYSSTDETPTCTITALPKGQLVKPLGLISLASYDSIKTVNITASTSGDAAIRYAVTPDLTNYYTYDSANDKWVSVETTAAGVLENGMTEAEVAAIPTEAWTSLTQTSESVGFAYALSMTALSETCYVDALTLTVDMVGSWRAAVYGSEFTYAYPNNVSMEVKLLVDGNWKVNYDAG